MSLRQTSAVFISFLIVSGCASTPDYTLIAGKRNEQQQARDFMHCVQFANKTAQRTSYNYKAPAPQYYGRKKESLANDLGTFFYGIKNTMDVMATNDATEQHRMLKESCLISRGWRKSKNPK